MLNRFHMRSESCIVLLANVLRGDMKLRANCAIPLFLAVSPGLGETGTSIFSSKSDGRDNDLRVGSVDVGLKFLSIGSKIGVIIRLDMWDGEVA